MGGEEKKPKRRSGIESTIGNTPLILIRSLSEATGCEIWGKAEVGRVGFFLRGGFCILKVFLCWGFEND